MRYIVAYGAAAIRELESAGFASIPYFDGAEICGSYHIGVADEEAADKALFEHTDRLEFYFIRDGAFA